MGGASRRAVFTAMVLLLIMPPLLAAGEEKEQEEIRAAIGRYMAAWNDAGRFNGSVLVARDGTILFRNGYGLANREWNVPNRHDTRFRIYSMSKQFTTLMVFQLAAEGKIDLDGKLTDYLEDYRKDTGGRVTIDHLLQNTSGIPCHVIDGGARAGGSPPFSWSERYDREEIVGNYMSGDLLFEPGSRYKYSNTGFYLLALVIEEVTGRSYEKNLRTRILDPLGMNDTGIDSNERLIPNRAEGYEKIPGGFTNDRAMNPDNLLGAGNLYSTVDDLLRWNTAFRSGRLLPEKWREKMAAVYWKEPREEYAYSLTWFTYRRQSGEEVRYSGFSGGTSGFNTDAFHFPEAGLTVVVLDNSTQYNHWIIAPGIYEILAGGEPPMPRPLASDAVARTVAERGVTAAVEQFRKIASDPGGRYAMGAPEHELNALGYGALRLRDFDLAIDVFKLNTELFPDSWNPWDSLGEAYLAAGRTEAGNRAYARAREMRDRGGAVIALLRSGEFEQAEARVRQALEKDPGARLLEPRQVGPMFDRALMAGEHDRALSICKVWALANPGTPGPYFSMARIHRAQGDGEAAAAAYRKILEMQPEGRAAEAARRALDDL